MDRTAGEAPFTDGDAQAAFDDGNRLAKAGDLEAAEDAYRRADDAGHPAGAAYAGVLAEARGETGQAEQAYRRADERGDGFGAFRLGLLRSRAGDWDGACQAWARAEERGQDRPPFDPAGLISLRDEAATAGPSRQMSRSTFASPVLIGAVTVLIALIAVFLAYNANTGLPFVPTRQLKVDIANGAQLVAGNDVDEGGLRIGLISQMQPVELPNGQVGAQLTVQLSKSNGKIPVDSTASIRPRSALGLKYLNIARGRSTKMFSDGGTLPISQTEVPVQFEDLGTMFDAKTRPAIQQNLAGYGDALTARGSALNDTISSLPSLFGHLQPVAQYLSDPRTQLTRFLGALNGFMSTVAPVAGVNVRLLADQATTFAAIARSPSDLENTIRETPATLDVSTASLKAQQPFLSDLTTLGGALAPATKQLEQALPNINPALAAGIKVLPRTPEVNHKLQNVFGSLHSLAADPGTNVALNGLNQTVGTLNPMVRYLGPFVTVCNQWNYFWTELAELVSEQTTFGMAQRVLIMFANHQATSVGTQGAPTMANGYQAGDVPGTGFPGDAEYLHNPNYGAAVNKDGTADCEAGQRGYPTKVNGFDPQGRSLDMEAYTPSVQGTTWTGLSRVPPGETFSRTAQGGPQLPVDPSNP
ncbi:MAG TPA: MlaD family protein [Solirubrobacteraceae bacterium]